MEIKNSSLIKEIHYVAQDTVHPILIVVFHNGQSYAYSDVPIKEYEKLMAADSIGSYFSNIIKLYYDCQKL